MSDLERRVAGELVVVARDREVPPAEVFHISEFICDELLVRGWTTEDAAMRMKTSRGFGRDLLILDLLLCVHDEKIVIDNETYSGLARAFCVSQEFFRNLHERWCGHPNQRSAFTPPESVFGPISRASILPQKPVESAAAQEEQP